MKTEEIDEIIKKAKIINDWCIDEHPDDDYYPGIVAIHTYLKGLRPKNRKERRGNSRFIERSKI